MKKKLAEIRAYMESRSKYGTNDTEPRATLSFLIKNAIDGGEYRLDPRSWGTYYDMPGGKNVARKLNRLGRELHTEIIKSIEPIREFLPKYY